MGGGYLLRGVEIRWRQCLGRCARDEGDFAFQTHDFSPMEMDWGHYRATTRVAPTGAGSGVRMGWVPRGIVVERRRIGNEWENGFLVFSLARACRPTRFGKRGELGGLGPRIREDNG